MHQLDRAVGGAVIHHYRADPQPSRGRGQRIQQGSDVAHAVVGHYDNGTIDSPWRMGGMLLTGVQH